MIGAMILAAAVAATPEVENRELAGCLVNLSNAPEFVQASAEELAQDETFLNVAIDSWCSDETTAFWSGAHSQARRQLGATEQGQPVAGQQAAAKAEMRQIVSRAWAAASSLRSDPPSLSGEKLEQLGLVWLLNKAEDDAALQRLVEGPVVCAARRLAAKGALSRNDIEDGAIKSSALGEIASACRYDDATNAISRMVSVRFPDAGRPHADKAATSFMGQMLFWATLAAGNQS